MGNEFKHDQEAYFMEFMRQKRNFYTPDQIRQMLVNGASDFTGDHAPVIRVFHPTRPITYLASAVKMDNDLHYRYWGLIDLGIGRVDEGEFRINDITVQLFSDTGYQLQPDKDFDAKGRRLSEFLAEARKAGKIVVTSTANPLTPTGL